MVNPETIRLATLIERGGVHVGISGTTPAEVLRQAASRLQKIEGLDLPGLTKALVEREALMPTALGKGIAMPHPRNPIITDPNLQRVAVFLLDKALPWQAIDQLPVFVLFLIISSESRTHLFTLVSLTHLCNRPDFLALLRQKPSLAQLLAYVSASEEEWDRRNSSNRV